MSDTRQQWNVRSLLQRADKTEPPQLAEVKPIKSWDAAAAQVNKTRTYLVQTQAEEHRREMALAEIRIEREQAEVLHEESKRQFAQMANDALGIGLAAPQKDARVDAIIAHIEREKD